jgi:aldehyde:ferredoxin oxidoreductase
LDTMLDEYYALRGWDREGIPTPETLDKLDLGDVARELQEFHKLRRAE